MEFTFSLAHISILAGSVIALIVASFFALSVVRRKMASSVNAGQKNKIDTIKYEFVTVITHKFRTPLTQIKWGAEGLRAAATETQKEIEFRKIERAADTIIAMTEVLLKVADADTSGIELQLEPVGVGEFVRSVANELSSDFMLKKVTPEFTQLSSTPSLVRIDKKQMRLVFLTIMQNAATYVQPAGAVHVTFREERGFSITEVFDNGVGIPKDELARVFDRFYRGAVAREIDQDGLGIGLYMSRKIINLHNGSLTLFSEGKGKGTVALIALPLAPLPESAAGAAASAPIASPISVLVPPKNTRVAETVSH
ncbi:MAG TPA: HAMP domain-containing sensor histidine kinase [Candidatus Paceibacterota bacterium]